MPSGVYTRKPFSEEARKNMSKVQKGRILSEETKKKMSEAKKGKVLSEETRKKISIDNKGKPSSMGMLGKQHSEETKIKMRLSAIKRIEENKLNGNQLIPFYNPKSIPIIEEYGKANGYLFQHAENGGEFRIPDLGYWVDGYDNTKNVVIEYYEKAHKYYEERDEKRKQEIISYLDCEFIEIKE